ncbi:MAG: hypothetical protein K2J36_00820 [Ruminococcus sp.]|nr:hypothetical protein [Ruminococcus sp.]
MSGIIQRGNIGFTLVPLIDIVNGISSHKADVLLIFPVNVLIVDDLKS